MRAFAYVIEHDLGFAPNPFHGFCTLACCKPRIRKTATVGDYILGMGASKPRLGGRLCYWMKVSEILSFDQYWADPRFRRKRPNMSGSTFLRYGDNIYHHAEGHDGFIQEDSFHSFVNGGLCVPNLCRDTATTDRVLIGREFAYWGQVGIELPESLRCFEIRRTGHKCRFPTEKLAELTDWLNSLPRGLRGEPAHWQFLNRKRRRKGATSREKIGALA
jgi:hypothetical protein